MPDDQPTGQPAAAPASPEPAAPSPEPAAPAAEQATPQPAAAASPPAPAPAPAAAPSPEDVAAAKERAAQEQMSLLAKRLHAMDVFRLFSEEEIRANLLPSCSVKSFKAGDTIVAEGEVAGHAFFLINGHVKMVKRGVAFAQLQRRGDIFAVEAMLGDAPAPASILAVKESTCLALAAGVLGNLQDETVAKFHSILYRIFAEKLAEQLREANSLVIKLRGQRDRLQKFLDEGL